jgi:LacI family transcriptional regulator
MVNISGATGVDSRIPVVAPDSRMIGQRAAEHLIGLGLKNLAYHGVRGRLYSDLRWEGFREAARAEGLKAVRFCVPHTTRDALWNERHEPLRKWIKTLPLPVGLFAVHDYRALIVLSACRDIGLRVPDEVAVVGADNNLMVCEFSVPTLSTVCINAYGMGQEAAKLLDRIMQGQVPPGEPILVDPLEVVARKSTDVLHLDDPAVKQAVQFMEKHYVESFTMDTVTEACGISRRSLEARFRATLETSPAEFLAKLRVKKAITLLNSQTEGTNEEIARQCGLVNGDNLRSAFRRILNASPSDFRARS